MNAKRGATQIDLAGNVYTLIYDFNAVCELEERCAGASIDDLLFAGKVPRHVLREALAVGMKRQHPNIKSREVGKLIAQELEVSRVDGLRKIMKAVLVGILRANGATDDQIAEIERATDSDVEDSVTAKGDNGITNDVDVTLPTVSEKADRRPFATIGTS